MRPSSVWCRLAPARPVGALWTILSFLVSLTCLFAFVQPVWFVGQWSNRGLYHLQPPRLTLGLFTFCQQVHGAADSTFQCHLHERLRSLNLPNSYIWHMSIILFGMGSVIFFVTSFIALFSLCCHSDVKHYRMAAATSVVQTFCVLSMILGLVLLPSSFGTPMVQSFCGSDAFPYHLGHCHLGWSYALAIVGVVLALFCPYLGRHTKFQSFDVAPIGIVVSSKDCVYQKLSDGREYFV